MKIAFIVSQFPSLSTTFILNQITGLLDRGYEIRIFALSKPKEKDAHSDVKKYQLLDRVYYINIPQRKIKRIFKAVFLLIINFHKAPIKILKAFNVFKYGNLPKTLTLTFIYALIPFLKEKFDIIHCQSGTHGNIGAALRQIGIKSTVITTFHGNDIRSGLENGGRIFNRLFKFGDCFLSISEYNYDNLVRFGADPEKIIPHPVGIDIKKFPSRKQTGGIESPDTIRILTVARLVEVKGLPYGIQAIYELRKKRPGLQLKYRIIGGGPLEEELRRLVSDLGLNDVVQFLGPLEHDRVIKNLTQSHIFLLPSRAEALPVSLMEAQAACLPVVATSVGAVSEVIVDGESGFLVPPKKIDVLVEKLEYLVEHPEIWPKMGQTGRKHIEENYNIDNLNNQLVTIYQKLLKKT